MLTSANGWPASADPEAIDIVRKRVPGTDLKLRVAKPVAPLLIGFAAEFHKLVEPIDESKTLDDWGYAYRKVRGSNTVVSNHSSGTAIDLNATQHPLAAVGTFNENQVRVINRLCRKYGLRWGGNYRNRKDEMHFEIALNAVQVETLIRGLEMETDEGEPEKTDQDSARGGGFLGSRRA